MSIFNTYQKFQEFINNKDKYTTPFSAYQEIYIKPYKEFFDNYFNVMNIKEEQLRLRVNKIKIEDYQHLFNLINNYDLLNQVKNILTNCKQYLYLNNVDVYLIIGFFSPDAFILEINKKPVIVVSLERFKDFDLLPILLSHEYCHLLQRILNIPTTSFLLIDKIYKEGLACYFSKMVVHNQPLYKYVLLQKEDYNYYVRKEPELFNEFINDYKTNTPDIITNYFVTTRMGYFLGFKIIEKYLTLFKYLNLIALFKTNPLDILCRSKII